MLWKPCDLPKRWGIHEDSFTKSRGLFTRLLTFGYTLPMQRPPLALQCFFAAWSLAVLPGVPASAQVIYRVVDGWAVSGDIILGRAGEVVGSGGKHTESTFINLATR